MIITSTNLVEFASNRHADYAFEIVTVDEAVLNVRRLPVTHTLSERL